MNDNSYVIYPVQFYNKRIDRHICFEEDLKIILDKSGCEQLFIRQYRLRLKFLEENWDKCFKKTEWFEVLKNTHGLFSMKFKDSKNIRILFKFFEQLPLKHAFLLVAFEEKKKADYPRAIQIAYQRENEIIDLLGGKHD